MGYRYSRLLRLLWRKAPGQGSDPEQRTSGGAQRQGNEVAAPTGDMDSAMNAANGVNPLNAFSWRDLDAVGQFVINDDALASSIGAYDETGQSFSAFDVFATDGFNNFHDNLGEFTF